MGVVKTLKSIREFFWPLLDPLDEVSIRQITIEDCKFNDDEIDMELKYLEDNKRSEEDRKKEVELCHKLLLWPRFLYILRQC